MARKRCLLFHRLYSLLRKISTRWLRRQMLLVLTISTFLFALTGTPVFSQHPDSQLASSPEQWFQQGQMAYDQQNYSAAIVELTRAIQAFEFQDKPLEQAIALGNLSLTHQALGRWQEAKDAIERSLELLQTDRDQFDGSVPDVSNQQLAILAPILDIDGQLWLKRGEFDRALTSWRSAMQIYQNLQNTQGLVGNQTRQLQVLHSLGLYGQAGAIAKELDNHLSEFTNPLLKARSLRTLGNTYRAIGELTKSETNLNRSLAEVKQLAIYNQSEETSATLLSLGNTQLALGNREKERQTSINRQGILPWRCLSQTALPNKARDHYAQAVETYTAALRQAPSARQQVAIQLNLVEALLELGQMDVAIQQYWTEISNILLTEGFTNRFGVYARIKLAKQGACFKQLSSTESLKWEPIIGHLKQAAVIAKELNDAISLSQALGNLGSLYEYFDWLEIQPTLASGKQLQQTVWHKTALELTEQALVVAQPYELPDIAYQWQWQRARLNSTDGQIDRAIINYRQAVDTLKLVRNNLLTIDSEVQFSFRDNVEPVYRELTDLLLRNEQPSQPILKEVIGLIDNIQLSELESFLQCNLQGTVELTDADLPETSAVVYTVILADRLEVISQGGHSKKLLHHRIDQPQSLVNAKLDTFRISLERPYLDPEAELISKEIYTWLIEPQLSTWQAQAIDTLVFVLDGALRNVPIAALQKQQGQYLIEEFAIAQTPRLQLKTPQPMNSRRPSTLLFGLSKVPMQYSSLQFDPLPFVRQEVSYVEENLPAKTFINEEFTQQQLQENLQSVSASVIHFATHGEFSSDPEKTFILAWDQAITSEQLNIILRDTPVGSEIELLILSACKTADGDNRATLGIAGIALQAGAQSTLASLWVVDDETTAKFIEYFYEALAADEQFSRAQALQQAQLKIKTEYSLPRYWAPYILVGNWL